MVAGMDRDSTRIVRAVVKLRDALANSLATEGLPIAAANLIIKRFFFLRIVSAIGLLRGEMLSEGLSCWSLSSHVKSLILGRTQTKKLTSLKQHEVFRDLSSLGLFKKRVLEREISNQLGEGVLLNCSNAMEEMDIDNVYTDSTIDRRVLLLGQVHEALKSRQRRKLKGVFYTPFKLAKTICELGLSTHFDGSNPESNPTRTLLNRILALRILDNACGGGAFLLAMLEKMVELLRTHIYEKGPIDSPLCDHELGSTSPASIAAFIVENCLYGADLDQGAVDTTEAQLWMAIASLRRSSHRTNCRTNLMIADSLSSSWLDGFAFDMIVGNPPYLRLSALDPSYSAGLRGRYATNREYNIHALFIEASMNQLKQGGVLAYLVHKNLLSLDSYAQLRRLLLNKHTLKHVSDCGAGVFNGVTAETGIIVIQKGRRIENSPVALSTYDSNGAGCVSVMNVPQGQYNHLVSSWNHRFITGITEGDVELFQVLRRYPRLATLASASRGIETGCNSRFISERPEVEGNWEPLIRGRDITSYGTDSHVFIDYKRDLLSKPGRDGLINLPKVLVQQNARNPVAYYDWGRYLVLNSATYIADASEAILKSICTLVNSRLVAWFFRTVVTNNAKLTVNLLPCNLGIIPVPSTFDENLLGALCDVLTMLRLSVNSSHYLNEAFSLWHNVIAEATILEAYFPRQRGTKSTTETLRDMFHDYSSISDFIDIQRDSQLVRTAMDTVDSIGVSRLLDSRP